MEENNEEHKEHKTHESEHHHNESEHKHVSDEHHQHHEHHEHGHYKENMASKLLVYFVVALGVITLLNLFFTLGLHSVVKDKLADVGELARPADIQIITLTNEKCDKCFDIKPILENVKKGNVKVKQEDSLDFSSEQGKQLIQKYNIEKIPTIIIAGEINKTKLSGFKETDNVLIFNSIVPPYTQASDGVIKGMVNLKILEYPKCEGCFDIKSVLNVLKESGVAIKEEKILDMTSLEGAGLVKKYNIDKFPSLILSDAISEYPQIQESWSQLGTVEDDGSYIFRKVSPPYYDSNEKRIVGEIDVVYLSDKSCDTCYNVTRHRPIILNFGINPKSEKYIDVSSSEGQKLVKKYGIELVPTIVLSKDADYFEGLKSVWKQVGKVADDGTYIFTNVAVMRGPYKDLKNDKVITPQPEPANAG